MESTRVVILPYKIGSKSARDLQKSLQNEGFRTLRVYPDRLYRPRENDFIVNWGYSGRTKWGNDNVDLNHPNNVAIAVNKLRTFNLLKANNVRVPEFTTDIEIARNWDKVYCRHALESSKGMGIEVVNSNELSLAPLYVKAIDVKGEYRVHVMNGKVIDYAKKLRRRDVEYTDENMLIRNSDNGWVFCRGRLRRFEDVEQIAVEAIEALGLDFGSVDIVKDENYTPYVLEVNTASGIEGTTLKNYTSGIISLIKEQYA